MTDYSKMSDFEINKAVAEKLFKVRLSLIVQRDVPSRPAVTVFCDIGDEEIVSIACADYCNNPADAWPIIVANRIGILPASNGDKWAAHYQEWRVAVADKNPLRAAMIVFLMMKGAGE